MDLTNYSEKYAKWGEDHKSNPNLFWSGYDWQEKKPSKVWDFNLRRDWVLLAGCLFLAGFGVVVLLAIN